MHSFNYILIITSKDLKHPAYMHGSPEIGVFRRRGEIDNIMQLGDGVHFQSKKADVRVGRRE